MFRASQATMKIRGWRRFLIFLPLLFFLPHFFSDNQWHYNSQVVPKKQSSGKFNHLVLGPAAGQGLTNRLQCQPQGIKALNNKTPSSTATAVDNIDFVTVFTLYNSTPADHQLSNLVTVGNASYTKVDRSMAILNIFVNFIQVAMPRSNVVILTDPATDLSMHRNGVTVYPIPGVFLETRMEELSQIQGHIHHYIFTDSDIAVVDDPGHIFHDYPNFHLALTFRNNKEQPLKSGFIGVRGTPGGIFRFICRIICTYALRMQSSLPANLQHRIFHCRTATHNLYQGAMLC